MKRLLLLCSFALAIQACGTQTQSPNTVGVCTVDADCPGGYNCLQNVCRIRQCDPGAQRCLNDRLETCAIDAQRYELQNMYLYFDICTLDSSLQSQYADMMRQGGALNVVYQSALMQTQTVLNNAFTIQILRNLFRDLLNGGGSRAEQAGVQRNAPPPICTHQGRRGQC